MFPEIRDTKLKATVVKPNQWNSLPDTIKLGGHDSFVAVSLSSKILSLIFFDYFHVYKYLLTSVIIQIMYFTLRACLSH